MVEVLPIMLPDHMVGKVGDKSLRELSHMPFFPVAGEVLDELDRKLWEIKVKVG